VNHSGWEGGNTVFTAGRDLPWLQDQDANSDSLSDTWTAWGVSSRDVVVLDASNTRVGLYNLTKHDLDDPQNYNTLRKMLIDAASPQAPWQNPQNPMDVNADQLLTPVGDVLTLVNELNLRTVCDDQGRLPPPKQTAAAPPPYYDVNGDDYLSPARDVLPLINYFNQPSDAEGEAATQTTWDSVPRAELSVARLSTESQPTTSEFVKVETGGPIDLSAPDEHEQLGSPQAGSRSDWAADPDPVIAEQLLPEEALREVAAVWETPNDLCSLYLDPM
jgi:hypothetical protein